MILRAIAHAVLAPILRAASSAGGDAFGFVNVAGGARITVRDAVRITLVRAALKSISETIAMMPCRLKEISYESVNDDAADSASGGRRRKISTDAYEHSLFTVLSQAPNDWQSAFEYWRQVVWDVGLSGNHFSYIKREGGRIVSLHPIPPESVTVEWSAYGRPIYMVSMTDETRQMPTTSIYLKEDIFHVRGLPTKNGLLGRDPLADGSETFGLLKSTGSYIKTYFDNFGMPLGMITPAKSMVDDQYKMAVTDWSTNFSGGNRHRMALMREPGWDVKTLSVNNRDAQYVEMVTQLQTEVCQHFRIPPYKLQILTDAVFNNVEQQNQAWVSDCLNPICANIQGAIVRDLLSPDERQTLTAVFDLSSLLAGDIKTQTMSSSAGVAGGWLSANDVREGMGKPPIGRQGDIYSIPVNKKPAETFLTDDGTGDGDEPPTA